ncbi:MAG: winged helix-turn-helix domain-containing protein [Acidobacteria bacterium]|nr:winged helix-turn-helix domain-containing protein [Acidobacteriota bacterium]
MQELNRRIYRFDNFRLDADNRQLRRDDKPLSLSPKAFDLLLTLVENKGRLVEKNELFTSVWQDQIVEESNLTVHISQIRKALGETKRNPRFIETVPGYGYRFVGDIADLEEELVIETETLSRITIEKEESENGRTGERENQIALKRNSSAPFLPFPLTKIIAVGAVVIISIVGIFWLSNRNQNNNALAPAALAEKQAEIKRLTSKGTVNYGVLSPDGKFFAYTFSERGSLQNSLWLGQTSGNSDVQLRPAADQIYNPRSFSADGNWLYYTLSEPRDFDNGTLFKMPTLGGIPQKLASGISVYTVVSPDEKRIAFVRANRENKTSSLVVANTDGSDEREIVARQAGQSLISFSLSWSPDDASVAFGNLAAARQITFGSSGHEGWFGIDWTMDGKIIYVARIDQSLTLWTMDADGESAKQITSAGFLDEKPSATADGKYIVFQSNRSGATEIWRMGVDGADLRQMTFGGKNSFPHSTPDGKTVIYTHNSNNENSAWRVSIEGGEAAQIADAECFNARVSPDGNFIACGTQENGKPKLAVIPITGGSPVKLFDVPSTYNFDGSIRWSPDGRFINYRDWANGVWRQSIGGDAPELLEGLPTEKLYPYDWSPDGKQFAFTRGREVRDAVLISDFR